LKELHTAALLNQIAFELRLIPDEMAKLIEALDELGCSLALATGGKDPAMQDLKLEVTLKVLINSYGSRAVAGIFCSCANCVDLIGEPYLETNDTVCKAFRPKTAIDPSKIRK
jgi:hypothetical protein